MPTQDQRARAAAAHLDKRLRNMESVVNQLTELQKASVDSPKWIEQLPGRRVPFWAAIDLTIAADSTSSVSGNYNVTEDGPFVMTGIAAFFQRTSGAYQGHWGFANTADARINGAGGQQHGFGYIYDQPNIISGDFKVVDRGSDRNWQNRELASALLSPEAGGVYVFPVACLVDRSSVIEVTFTPGVSIPQSGKVQMILCGYKIVQGSSYQP
jgi:hypothetical protein